MRTVGGERQTNVTNEEHRRAGTNGGEKESMFFSITQEQLTASRSPLLKAQKFTLPRRRKEEEEGADLPPQPTQGLSSGQRRRVSAGRGAREPRDVI
ncbi:hypothetical protein ROHU_017253 [Labeo rohita]|uniref:Uncharacterized protein n=1 Tax=Labeo rohita TaxID=84645 RepID=A0A498NH88_LABRO|nr:hypothetical protein ROHU_012208 [Labeo rohita]RXN31181.1 hypothetical protein ROHU_017253 [Labeo rohita]